MFAVDNLLRRESKIKATDQLSGVVDEVNGVVSSHQKYWDTGTSKWKRGVNSNPATQFREVAEGKGNKRALDEKRVNLKDLQVWAANNETALREFNQVADFSSSVGVMLTNIAATGRASVSRRDGLWGIVEDKQQTVPVQVFTPRNSWGFQGEKLFTEIPHAVKIRFLNKAKEYLQDERTIYDDGFSAANATLFESIDFEGVVDSDRIWEDGRFQIAQVRLRPQIYSLNADVEHIVATRGGMCLVQHDVTLWGISSGRVKSVADDAGAPPNALTVTLDNVCPMESGKTYNIRLRLSDGTQLLKPVNLVVGDNFVLTFTTPYALNDGPRKGDIFAFGESGTETQELLLTEIEPLNDIAARLLFIDHSPAVYTADAGPIPTFNSNITLPIGLTTPSIVNIRSDESVLVKQPDGSLQVRMVVTWTREAGLVGDVIGVEASFRRNGSAGSYNITPVASIDAGNVSIFGVDEGALYDVRLRWVKVDNSRGPWSTIVSHTVIGTTLAPPDLDSFVVDTLADGTRRFSFSITAGAPLDIAGYQIRTDISAPSPPDWDVMTRLHPEGLITESPYETNELAAGFYTFAIKAIDRSGIESENAVFITATLGDPRLKDVLVQRLEHVLGFPGTKVDCHVGFAGFLRANDDAGDWASLSTSPVTTWASLSSKTWETITPRKSPIVYTTPVIDLSAGIMSCYHQRMSSNC